MIASLPMYDRPETAEANDRFWALIRDALRNEGIDAPETLTRDNNDLWATWEAPDLVLSQTCGLPFSTRLKNRVTRILTPDYALPGCPPGYYASIWVWHREREVPPKAEWGAALLAHNGTLSQSGWGAPVADLAAAGTAPGRVMDTGAHRNSARAVAEGRADLACIDAHTLRMIRRWEPEVAAELQEVGQTRPTPGLPLITAAGRDPAPYRRAVVRAMEALSPADRATLDLHGLVDIPDAAYFAVEIPPDSP